MSLQNTFQQRRAHLLGWCLFILYETGGLYLATRNFGPLAFYFLFYPLNIALFYVNAGLVLPRIMRSRNKFLAGAALISAELGVYLMLKTALDALAGCAGAPLTFSWCYLVYNLWRGLYFFGFSTFYWSILRTVRFREKAVAAERKQLGVLVEKVRLEKSLAELDNAYLRQQINPHFLFNALNFIFHSFYKLSAPAADCISKLADILRYSLEPAGDDGKTWLVAEVEQIRNLIALNRLRFDFPLAISFEVRGRLTDQRILPLVLLTFTENIFKYGLLKDPGRPAEVRLTVNEQNQLCFYCSNAKKQQPAKKKETIGLANSIKRLNYAYPGAYDLKVRDEPDTFTIDLQLNL